MKRAHSLIKVLNAKTRGTRMQRFLVSIFFWNPLIAAFFVGVLGGGLRSYAFSLVICTIVSCVCWGSCAAYQWLEERLYPRFGKPVPKHSGTYWMALSCMVMPLGLKLAFVIVSLAGAKVSTNMNSYKEGMIWGLAIAGIFLLWETRQDARDAHQKALLQVKELENDRLQAQVSALTAQMNPHLLFNSLNTIASLIPSHPQSAENLTVQLAELYRGVLSSSRNMRHTLDREIEICRSYLEIEKARLGERLNFTMQIDSAIGAHEIPALLVQPLVENAIKHGIAPRSQGGKLVVKAARDGDTLVLRVEDDGVGYGASKIKTGTGTSLQNCRSRLELSHGSFDIIALPEGGTRVELRLPAGASA